MNFRMDVVEWMGFEASHGEVTLSWFAVITPFAV